MTRFFVRPDQIAGDTVTLDSGDAHHLRVVLKAQAGDRIAVLDGSGREWEGTLTEIGKARAAAQLSPPRVLQTEPPVAITVAQALAKQSDKMEQVWQRGTEIGVSAFWAFESARSLTHLTGERHEKRVGRWAEIVKTAAEQAHRAILPSLRVDGTLETVLASAGMYDLALFAHPDARQSTLRQTLSAAPQARTILVAVGPESGFTDAEVRQAQRSGLRPLSLGPRILRTETAALVIAAQILFAQEQNPCL